MLYLPVVSTNQTANQPTDRPSDNVIFLLLFKLRTGDYDRSNETVYGNFSNKTICT